MMHFALVLLTRMGLIFLFTSFSHVGKFVLGLGKWDLAGSA